MAHALLPGIAVSANGRYFTFSDGTPFFGLDTQWNFWRCRRHGGRAILKTVRGVSVVQAAHRPRPAEGDLRRLHRRRARRGLPERDLRRPNESFFRHVDGERARELGIVLVIGLDHPRTLLSNPATAREWGRWVGERFRGRENIVWIPSYTIPEGANLEVTRLIASGLRGAARPGPDELSS
jgi:hypothetical protein